MINAIQWGTISSANTAKDGTGTVVTIYDAAHDSYIDRIVFRALGSNVPTVARLFVNNGSDTTTAANNSLIAEKTLPTTTLDETAQLEEQKIITDLWLPKSYRLTLTIGTTVAAGYQVTAFAGRYFEVPC